MSCILFVLFTDLVKTLRVHDDTYEKITEFAKWKDSMDVTILRLLETHERARKQIRKMESKKTTDDELKTKTTGTQGND